MSEEKKAPAKVERERKNGQTRPKAGSTTGTVWDIADAVSKKAGRPALRSEVFDEYIKKFPKGSLGTVGTQYSRWCAFNGAGPALKKFRNEQKATKASAVKEKKPAAEKKADVKKPAAKKAVEKKAA